VNPNQLFESLGTIPQLRKLNLSRNKLTAFHSDSLPRDNSDGSAFGLLEELNLSFNCIELEESLFYCPAQLPNLKMLVITGNPFSITGTESNYQVLGSLMRQKGGQLINETLNSNPYQPRGAGSRGKAGYAIAGVPQSGAPMMVTQGPRPDPLQADEAALFPATIPQQLMEDGGSAGDQNDGNQDPGFFLTEQVGQDLGDER